MKQKKEKKGFFEEVSLDANSWHYKLQGFVLGSERPDLYSLCPYFWLTVLCIVLLPIMIPVRGFEGIGKLYHRIVHLPKLNKAAEKLTKKDAAKLWRHEYSVPKIPGMSKYEVRNRIKSLYLKRMGIKYYADSDEIPEYISDDYWFFEGENFAKDYKTLQEELKALYREIDEACREAERKAYQRKLARQEKMDRMVQPIQNAFEKITLMKVTIWFQRIMTILITCGLAFGVGAGLMFLFHAGSSCDWANILFHIELTLGFFSVVAIIAATVYEIRERIEIRRENRSCESKKKDSKLKLFFFPVWTVIRTIGIAIGKVLFSPFKLFWMYFKSTKNNYCPGINWVNKD